MCAIYCTFVSVCLYCNSCESIITAYKTCKTFIMHTRQLEVVVVQ